MFPPKIACLLGILLGSIIVLCNIFYSKNVDSTIIVSHCHQQSESTVKNLTEKIVENKSEIIVENKKEERKVVDENNSQVAIKRQNCIQKGYNEKAIRKANSDPLPKSNWSYDTICSNDNSCVPKFVQKIQRNLFYPIRPFKIASCQVHKSMSTVFKQIACLLDNPLKFLTTQNELIGKSERVCEEDYYNKTNYQTIQEGIERFDITAENGWEYAMILRDPIDRFLSGYIHLCIYGTISTCQRYCNNCGTNMTCFLEKELENMMNVSKTRSITDLKTSHMAPQSWQCELHTHFDKYQFIMYHSNSTKFVDESLVPFFQTKNVSPVLIDYIKKHLTSKRTSHSTSNSKIRPFLEEKIRNSSYLMQIIMQLFYNDYKVFNFELPNIPKN